ncbi:unnamed protein product [Cuscuta europaea]|uniref:Uncharacterized protein n=1 Tax=Cuscuta europaea TaxID=41803 RepID=A0A9P0YSB5_CUSEU|nr:unnamed protein product [Cuscuta europaea]
MDVGKRKMYQFWVEEKLDRIMNDDWWNTFMEAQAALVEAPTSDHYALWMKVIATNNSSRRKRFKFENNWVKEEDCRMVVTNNWGATAHLWERAPPMGYKCNRQKSVAIHVVAIIYNADSIRCNYMKR